MAEIHPRTAPVIPRAVERLTTGALVLLAALLLILVPAGTALAEKPRVASLTAAAPKVTGVTETSAKLRFSGTVELPKNLANTPKNRSKVRVAVTIEDPKRKTQSFTAKIDAKRKYAVTKTTKLRGALTIRAQARVGGKPSGKVVTRKVSVRGAGSPTGGGPSTGGGSTAGGGGAVQTPIPVGTEKLVGLFKFDTGRDYPDGRVEGTYFRMVGPGGPPNYLHNGTSNARDPTYTLLGPGTDGGLRTDLFQSPPTPAFAGGNTGDSLANRITQPRSFFGVGFSIVTDAIDPQAGLPDPLPEIYHSDGKLSGQITAWAAQWNGQSFNQGTPKPDGTSPGYTTPLTGTYDPGTRRFALGWTSLIVGGPFNGYSGQWHLVGTFVPAGS